MATKQDLKAKALKELEEEQKQYQKQQEAKQNTAKVNKEAKQSTAKANKEADLIGAKDAEKLNKTKSTGAVGTKQGLNDSMAKRLGAEKGLEIIENRKAEKAAEQEAKKKTEAFASKEADLPGYKPGQTMSQEEMFRLLHLDTEEAEQELSEKRAEYTAAGGGTVGAVRSGMKLGNPSKTVVRDYEGLKAREEDIEKRERDIMLSGQLKKEVEQAEIIGNPEKMELGLKGYEKYLAGKEAAEKEKQSFFEQAVFSGFNALGNDHPTAGFPRAVKAIKEDTSEIEPNDSWSEEQKRIFGYYIYTGDLNKANEYALSVNNAIRAGEKEKALKETTKFGMNNKFLADVASVPGSMLRGAGFLDDLAQYAAQGYITENSMPLPGEMIDAYRGTRGEMLNIEHGTLGENAGILEGKGFGDLYQIGMSTADSLFAAYTGGKPGALVSAFGSSATSAVDDALARGATAEQAIGYGALSGAAELLPEYMSVDSLLKILPSGGVKMLADIGRQGLTEGAEGLITSLSSALADEAVMGELSKYNIEVNNLMLSGLSREEAEKIAQNSVNEEIILDTIGEALGGLGSGGFAVSIQNFTAGKKNAPIPFEGTAQPGTEAAMVADKITEIENRPISEADKAAKMEEVIEAVEEAGTEEGLYKEAAKSAEYHKKRAADFEEAVTVGKKLGITVEFDENLAANGVHTADGRIIINPNTENPVLQVLIHELTHDIETSGLYKQLSGNILGFVEEQGISLDSMRQMVKADYSEAGIKLSPEQTDAEIVAKFAEKYLFTDERAIQRLCNTEPTLFEKIRYWISDMVIKLRGTAEENFLLEAERLYEKALATRGERTGAGTEQYNVSSKMTIPEIQTIQNIGRISVNNFAPQDIKNTERFAKTYWHEMGTKSPFFRAWFGDWRANDQTPVQIADQQGNATGTIKNDDTGWDIQVSRKVFSETKFHNKDYNIAARAYLPYINDITKNAVLLDSVGLDPNKPKSQNSLLVHSMYAIADIGNGPEVLKLYVEEMYDPNKPETTKRDYQLQNIEKYQSQNMGSQNNVSPISPANGIEYTVSDIFDYVKAKDSSFAPKAPSKIVDEDGKPLIVYHGTDADFTVFDRTKSRANMDIQGNFFSPWEDDARGYGSKVGAYYLNIKNPADEATAYRALRKFQGQNEAGAKARDYLVSLGYDGVNNNNEEFIAFYPEQVKSATDNIGAFDPQNPDYRYSSGRNFDELAGNARANHGIAEEFSAEITDSARRVIEQMPGKPKDHSTAGQVNPESESTKLADVPQSEKSKRIEKRYQRAVEEGVASVFGVSRSDLKGEIRPIVEEISAKLKAGEKIGKEQIENLYKTAFDAGIITEEFPQYDATRRYIRGTKIYIDQKTRDEFGEDFEFRDFARSNFGNMKFSSDPRDSHLDSFYKSLSEMEPDMFHEDETDPKTQLEEIADFMQQTKKQYYGLAEVYSGKDLSDFEIWAKGELQNYMNEFSKGIDTVRGYERDRQIKATNKAREIDREASFDLAKAAFRNNRVFEAQKAMEKAKANALLKDADLIVVKRLHEGTLTEADVILQNAGNVEGIIEVYKAEKAYREARAPFDRYKAAYKTALQHDAVDLTELSDEWEDKKIGALYSRETAERNIRDIAGKGGEKIIAEYITPVHEHEAEKTRWIREMNQRVLDLDLGKMNRYERAYAQMIGENASYIAEGRITKHDQAEHDALNERISVLLSEHGNKINKAKCEKAAAGLMEIYEDIRNQWNDERIRRGQEPVGEIENYFPHFTETKPENLLQKIFSWFGIDISSSKLPTDIAGRTADRRPNTKYNPHANRRTSDVTDYDILKGFDGYVRAVGDNIFHTEDIQKLRALSDTIRTKYSSEETEKRIEEIRNRNDLSEEDKEVLIADTFKAMPGAYHLSNFVVWLDEYTNILAGKKSRGDREAEYQMGREIYDVSKAIEGRIASNMIGYNLSTPVMNLVPLFQATADISPVDIISSVLQTGVAAAKGDSYISDNSDFLTNRFGADTVYKKNYSLFTAENMKDAVAKINDGGAYFMEFVDRIVSEALLRARYQQNLKKGLDKVSAFSEADQWAAGLIADRSLGALPTVFNVKNPVAKALSMFQVEANNQYSYIFKDAGKYKWQDEGALNTITGQIAFWTAMALCNGLAKELLGRDNVVPDPVGLSAKSLGKIIKGEPVGDVALDAATTAVEQLPFVGGLLGGGRVPISTAIPDIEQAAKLFNPEVSFDKKKQILLDEISKPFSYILLPSGAGQLWKTGKGIKQIAEGGAFGMENDGSEYLKFPQEYDPESLVKTLLFGQYASDAGQNYIDSGFKDKLSVKQTQQMELAENLGISKEEFYNTVLGLKGIRKTEDKQEALYNNEDLSADVKAKFDYVLFGKPTYKATENGYIEPERNYTSMKEFYRSGLSETEKRLDAQGFNKTEIDKIEKAIKDGGNKNDDIKNIANALGISEQEAFEVYQKRNGNWITENSAEDEERAQKAEEFYGMSTERFNTVLNYSKDENAVSDIAKVFGIGEEEAKILLDRVTKYEYTKADLDEERIAQLETAGEWYDVEERGYFIARNAIKSAKGEKDRYGNTISGSKKAEAIEEISRQLNVDEEESKIYYLAANGDLALSRKDLSSAKQKDLEEALKHGWTERQFLDAVNIIKISGATRKSDIINALVSFGAPYEMAVGYYNLSENYDYFKRS